jgi:hypothetical protein
VDVEALRAVRELEKEWVTVYEGARVMFKADLEQWNAQREASCTCAE